MDNKKFKSGIQAELNLTALSSNKIESVKEQGANTVIRFVRPITPDGALHRWLQNRFMNGVRLFTGADDNAVIINTPHENNKPKHPQGEWKVKPSVENNYTFCILNERDFQVGKTEAKFYQTMEDASSSAKRIVCAVNMHDEFIDGLKRISNYIDKEGYSMSDIRNIDSHIKQLLKQAEQK